MILVLSSPDDPMGKAVAEELSRRNHQFAYVSVHDIPRTVKLRLSVQRDRDAFIFPDEELLLAQVGAVYHRVGFSNFEVFEEYSEDEVRFVNSECQMALAAWLNNFEGEVVNRPSASASNASKPFQATRIQAYGLAVPDTIVTNLPGTASEFYTSWDGEVIYKSISYHRSVVQKMTEDDLERLDRLEVCPVQLQARVDGFDVRVHVVGGRGVFASRIESSGSDYRYAKDTEITPFQLPEDIEAICVEMTRGLGLSLSGIDLRITPEGEVCCFEVNPAPAFRWYEDRTGQPITACLVDHLVECKRGLTH